MVNRTATPTPEPNYSTINITTERIIRNDLPDALRHPFEFKRALPQHDITRLPDEPGYFKEWLDEQVKLTPSFTSFDDYLDQFIDE